MIRSAFCGPTRTFAAGLAAIAALIGLPARDAAAAPVQTVALRTGDGALLVATLYLASTLPAPAVVLVHMQTRTRADWADLGERLADAGVTALAFDLRGHGASTAGPGPTAAGGIADASLLDVQAARAYLASRADVVPGRIGMIGASIGANLALAAAAAEPTVRSVVLLSPGIDYHGIRGDAAIRRFGRRPALVIASLEDPYAVRSARELERLGEGTCELRLLDGAGHGTTMLARQPDLLAAIVDWCRRTLL